MVPYLSRAFCDGKWYVVVDDHSTVLTLMNLSNKAYMVVRSKCQPNLDAGTNTYYWHVTDVEYMHVTGCHNPTDPLEIFVAGEIVPLFATL